MWFEVDVGGLVFTLALVKLLNNRTPLATSRPIPSTTKCVIGMNSATPSFRVGLASKHGIGLSRLGKGMIVLRFATD